MRLEEGDNGGLRDWNFDANVEATGSGRRPVKPARSQAMTEAYICDYVRTPIGRYGGSLATVRADDLAALPICELMRRHPGLADKVEEVFLGCATRRARTTATSHAWRCCSPDSPTPFRA
jgi:hypothetical protein